MPIATAPAAPADQRLHRAGVAAYWRAVDRAIAREVAALEAAERGALAETRAALAEAEAEHAALLARISEIDAANRSAAVDAVTDGACLDEVGTDGVREHRAAADAERDVATAVADATNTATAPVIAELADTVAEEDDMDHTEPHADVTTIDPIAVSLEAAGARRRAALAALDDRLAPVRAERDGIEASLAAALRANADLRRRLAGTACAKASAATL